MTAEQIAIVAGGAVGGIVYPLVGYFKAKRADETKKQKVSFDVNKILQPVFYGALVGVAGIYLGPEVIGIPSPDSFTTAVPIGMSGAVIIEKLLKAESENLKNVATKVKTTIKN